MLKVNLGSGPDGLNSWDNLDWGMLPLLSKLGPIRRLLAGVGVLPKSYLIDWPKIKLVDIRKRLPYPDSSVDVVYCSHVLEHFYRFETENILKEVKRIIKKDGVVRIVLPDLEKIKKNETGSEGFNRKYLGYEADKDWGWRRRFIREHRWMYDFKSLAEILSKAGLKKIKKSQWRKGECPDIDKLDLSSHQDHSFYVEAKK
ncbi:MAG: methyltransferase domain-containing protein [Candidatus Shapirobacteria bacterium]